ncbi:uncharacterized protein LOC133183478 [Saccostrea echinata]|uniref:uncharacterized protein LOC133183478 n=1 Tax=Saccostrea echinata TaxID=191078 RepID=UPI002A7F4A16|nr:uncharacterized protein LOC133183478 [Saccostrea echinata]
MDERYKFKIFGIHDGRFLVLHSTALVFIGLSVLCAGLVIATSIRNKRNVNFFFGWSKCERFAIYMAVCDIMLHLVHCTDHIHMLIVHGHVHPINLCEFYGFVLYEFTIAQTSLVFIIATNAFLLIKFKCNLNYGARDWRIISVALGVPFIICVFLASYKQLGPTGTYCGIVGEKVVTFISTLPVLLVLIFSTMLYILTWKHIKIEGKKVTASLRNHKSSSQRSARAAKNMSLFVAAYFIQWWALPLHGVWQLVDNTPFEVLELLAIFTNMGGILNGGVYLIIKKSRIAKVKCISHEKDGSVNNTSPTSNQTQCS